MLNSGECVRINTGAPLPPGADAVVQVEDTKLIKDQEDGRVEVEIEILTTPVLHQEIRLVYLQLMFIFRFHILISDYKHTIVYRMYIYI